MNAKRRAASLLLGVLFAACAGSPAIPTPAGSSPLVPSPTPIRTTVPTATPAPTAAALTASPLVAPTPTAVPLPGPTAAPTPSSCVTLNEYVVVTGDTLWGIAHRHEVTLDALLAANPQVRDRRLIRPGERIAIPPSAIDLGTPDGYQSAALDINNSGQIVGRIQSASGRWRAFLWQDGAMTDIGTLGGSSSEARAINNLGQVVGGSSSATNAGRGFLWQDGVMTDLGTLGGVIATVPMDINDQGQVVGAANPSGRTSTPFSGRTAR
jgi:probable HAF family extracellular repeat protein